MTALVLSCEHATNRVPRAYAPLFTSARARAALASHRGWDPGALAVARALGRRLGVPPIVHEVTRLLVEPNRSPDHPRLFSEFMRDLDDEERERVLARYYLPHRTEVEEAVAALVARGARVLHVGVHSFTPRLHGEVRRADLALLYDPARKGEREVCARWKRELRALDPSLRVRRNYPYKGVDDGLTTYLRSRFPERAYLGVELEMNQDLIADAGESRATIVQLVGESLERVLG